jgi:hypothetical protein
MYIKAFAYDKISFQYSKSSTLISSATARKNFIRILIDRGKFSHLLSENGDEVPLQKPFPQCDSVGPLTFAFGYNCHCFHRRNLGPQIREPHCPRNLLSSSRVATCYCSLRHPFRPHQISPQFPQPNQRFDDELYQ